MVSRLGFCAATCKSMQKQSRNEEDPSSILQLPWRRDLANKLGTEMAVIDWVREH